MRATLVSLGSTLPTFLHQTAWAAAPTPQGRRTVLIVVQLAGGNDGLNTVVPFDHDDTAGTATRCGSRANEVLKINDSLGFHPRLQGFERLFKDGHLSVVPGRRLPATRTAAISSRCATGRVASRTTTPCQTGWLGRAVDRLAAADDPSGAGGVSSAKSRKPFTLNAQRAIVPVAPFAGRLPAAPAGRRGAGRAASAAT